MAICGDTSRLIFDRLKGVNHTRLARVFYLEEAYDWLFSHSLSDSIRMADKDVTITSATLKTAYENLSGYKAIMVVDPSDGVMRKYHVVKEGETWASIAVENNTTVSILLKLNKKKKDAPLREGMKIRVK